MISFLRKRANLFLNKRKMAEKSDTALEREAWSCARAMWRQHEKESIWQVLRQGTQQVYPEISTRCLSLSLLGLNHKGSQVSNFVGKDYPICVCRLFNCSCAERRKWNRPANYCTKRRNKVSYKGSTMHSFCQNKQKTEHHTR